MSDMRRRKVDEEMILHTCSSSSAFRGDRTTSRIFFDANAGITKAKVLPNPVAANMTTSFFLIRAVEHANWASRG